MTAPLTHDRNRDLLIAEGVERIEEGAEPADVERLLAAIPPAPPESVFRETCERLQEVPETPTSPPWLPAPCS